MDSSFPTPQSRHRVLGSSLLPPFPDGLSVAMFGMGCFWGGEKLFWQHDGIHTTMVGYAGGHAVDPTYTDVCSGRTGHAEVIRIVYDEKRIDYHNLLSIFWENHDPTQYMAQGPDRGTQYRTGIYYYNADQEVFARETKDRYQKQLSTANRGEIVTEILPAPPFYYAEAYHQQYLEANPGGYCGHGGTGVCFRA